MQITIITVFVPPSVDGNDNTAKISPSESSVQKKEECKSINWQKRTLGYKIVLLCNVDRGATNVNITSTRIISTCYYDLILPELLFAVFGHVPFVFDPISADLITYFFWLNHKVEPLPQGWYFQTALKKATGSELPIAKMTSVSKSILSTKLTVPQSWTFTLIR